MNLKIYDYNITISYNNTDNLEYPIICQLCNQLEKCSNDTMMVICHRFEYTYR
jgi:hypothetical protein